MYIMFYKLINWLSNWSTLLEAIVNYVEYINTGQKQFLVILFFLT